MMHKSRSNCEKNVRNQDIKHCQKQITDVKTDDVFSRTDSGNGGNYFSQLEFVKDGGFTGGIKTNHENSHLLLPE